MLREGASRRSSSTRTRRRSATDPGFADRTHLEPLDLEGVAGVLARAARRACQRSAGRRLLSARRARSSTRGSGGTRRRAHRGGRGCHPAGRGSRASSVDDASRRSPGARVHDRHELEETPPKSSTFRDPAAGLHARRPRRRDRGKSLELRRMLELGRGEEPRLAGARGGPRRLGRVRPRVMRDARQRRRRLLDRDPRSDGCPHGRLDHGRPADDAFRRGVPGAAGRGGEKSSALSASTPAARTSSCARARHGRAARHRDEPAVSRSSALASARPASDRLGRGEAAVGYTLDEIPAALRARHRPASSYRLTSPGRVPTLRLREVPGRGRDAPERR